MAVIGLDLGGTKLSGGIFAENGKILFKDYRHLERRTGKAVGSLIQDFVKTMYTKADELKVTIFAVGICVPGISYHDTGCVWCPNIEGWDNYPLKKEISEVVNKDVIVSIDSDRACSILGEAWQGAAQGCANAIFMAVGTGIGAGILVNNQVLRGAHDIAGAIGWWALDTPYQQKYKPCGCFEYHASGEGIAKVARELLVKEHAYNEVLSQKSIAEITSRDVFEAYKNKDKLAAQTLHIAVEFWGMAVANLVSIFDPEKIIFGGGVFGPALQFLPEIYEQAKLHAQPISIQKVKLEGSKLGTEAVLVGAGYMAIKSLE